MATDVHNSLVARAVQLVPLSTDTYTWPPLATAAITAPLVEMAIERQFRSLSRAFQVTPALGDT
jgi:hypothetical protein